MGKTAHAEQCYKSRALTKVIDLNIKIEPFEQQGVILKGFFSKTDLKNGYYWNLPILK